MQTATSATLARPTTWPTWRAGVTLRVGTPAALALGACSGAAYASGFPPLSWPLAPWVALVPLLVACATSSPARAALAALCWTAAAAVGVAGFLPTMLARYFGLAPAVAWLVAVLAVVVLHGVWICAWAAWVAWLARRGAAHPVLIACGWVACEVGRAHGTLGSPWALTAYSQLAWTPVVQIADLGGPYGIALVVAAVDAVLAAWLVPALRGRRPRRDAAVVAAAVAITLLYGAWRLGQDFADGPPVRVAVVQAGPPAAGAAARAARLARHVALSTGDAAAHADLIVWPEHALDDYLEEPSPARDAVRRLGAATHADLVVGGAHFAASPSGTRYHNAVWLLRDGRVAARYDKHRLVPFAEDAGLAWAHPDATPRYTPGAGAGVLRGTALRLGTLICVEAMFPDLARRAVRHGAEVLVNPSNDGWFADGAAARHQLAIATLRAVETRRYLVRAAATGVSAIVDPYGRMLVESASDAPQALAATVRAAHVHTPYERCGDVLAWLAIGGVAVASWRVRSRPIPPDHSRRLR